MQYTLSLFHVLFLGFPVDILKGKHNLVLNLLGNISACKKSACTVEKPPCRLNSRKPVLSFNKPEEIVLAYKILLPHLENFADFRKNIPLGVACAKLVVLDTAG